MINNSDRPYFFARMWMGRRSRPHPGSQKSFTVVSPQFLSQDFTIQAAKLAVPVYIYAGREDVNAMSSLVEEYFNILRAPLKKLIWLEGGHGLGDENLSQFVDVMVNTVLPETQAAKK